MGDVLNIAAVCMETLAVVSLLHATCTHRGAAPGAFLAVLGCAMFSAANLLGA